MTLRQAQGTEGQAQGTEGQAQEAEGQARGAEGHPFQYAVLRAVPRVERGEFINVGVILYCQALDYLAAAVVLDDFRLRALAADVDLDAVRASAEAVVLACRELGGSARDNTGLATRFGMLTAPRSTVVQPSPVHAGLTRDPEHTLGALLRKLVAPTP